MVQNPEKVGPPDQRYLWETLRLIVPRFIFLAVAWQFARLVKYVYVDILVPHDLFAYMGLRIVPVGNEVQGVFLLVAVIPSLWLPLHMRRPTDIVELYLYYAVHVPTCVLLPLVSYSSSVDQFLFAIAILLGLLILDVRYRFPRLNVPTLQVSPREFWFIFALFYIFTFYVFSNSGYLSFSNIDLIDVYGQRLELKQRAAEVGPTFFYLANWSGGAIGPFLIIAALHKRRPLLLVAGIAIAFASFIASSNKLNYMGVPAVIAGYVLIRMTRGRHIAVILGLCIIILTLVLLVYDQIAMASGSALPMATWIVFHRTFTNNGFLSAVYLDLFKPLEPAFYSDSFLRWFLVPRLEAPVQVMAGASFTEVPDVHANANLWADGYANLGYPGIAFSALSALLVFWVYDSLCARKNQAVAAAALVVPATVIANTSVHTALLSNGMVIIFLLVWLWTGSDREILRGH